MERGGRVDLPVTVEVAGRLVRTDKDFHDDPSMQVSRESHAIQIAVCAVLRVDSRGNSLDTSLGMIVFISSILVS